MNPNMDLYINLRQEFTDLTYGADYNTGIGMLVLIRRLRRDPLTFARTVCPCTDPLTREADLDTICPYCMGDGFFWDEEWARTFKVAIGSTTSKARRHAHSGGGIIAQETYMFFFAYDANIRDGDSIIEVELDEEGDVAQPGRRTIKWSPNIIEQKRLDGHGRIEYYIVSCAKSNAIYIDKETEHYIENP